MKKSYSNFAAGLTRILIVLAICTFLISIKSFAQQFTPVLIGKTKDTIFRMSLISADLKINCNEQRISFDWLLTYSNPLDEWIEGELTMPMLKNQLITGFDMNIKDVLRKGMLAEKQQAKTVYERIVSRRCDPGLLEIINGNTFKLRIFPIMGEELKTVRLSYECDYEYKDGIFSLNYPFDFIDNLKEFNIEIDAEDVSGAPFIESNIEGLKFDNSKFAEKSIENFSSRNFFKIMFRNNLEQPLTVFSEFNDEMYFSTLYKSPVKFAPKEKIEHLTFVVDASYSQRKNNFYPERHFLKEYLKKIQNVEIKVIVFSLNIKDEKVFSVKDGNSDEIISFLENVEYLGATNYGCLNLENLQTDQILFLSNGVNNMGSFKYPIADIPIHFLNSNPDYDESFIRRITDKTNGRFINLAKNNDVFSSLDLILKNSALMQIIDFAKSEVSDLQITKYNENPDIYRITGKMAEDVSTIFPVFASGEKSDSIVLDTDINELSDDISIPRLWANSKVSELSSATAIDTSAIVKLSKDLSFATKFSSFIVLETARQYFDSYIDPPPDLKEEYEKEQAEYDEFVEWENEYFLKYIKDSKDDLDDEKKELEKLKFNYYDYYKDLFEYFKNQPIEGKIDFDNFLSTELNEKGQTGVVLPKPYIKERSKYNFLSSLSFLKNGLVVDYSNSFFIPKIDNDFDSIRIKLINNDSVTFRFDLEKGKLNVIDLDIFDEFKKRGIGFGDVSIIAKDSSSQYIDTVNVIVNSKFTETITKQNNQIKDLLKGENNFYVYDSEKEYNKVNFDIRAGQENKLILDTKEIKSYLEYGVIDTDSSGLGTLTGFVRDEYGNILNNAFVFVPKFDKINAVLSDSSGRFVLSGIEPGEYNVRFIIDMTSERKDVVIKSNKITKIGLVHIFRSSNKIDELFWLHSPESSTSGGRYDGNNTSIELLQENSKAVIDSIIELAEKYLKEGDTTRAVILLSGIYDIENEKASYMYKLSAYFCRVKNLELAIDAYQRTQYFNPDSVVRDFKLARIYEDCGEPDSALKLYEKLLDYSYLRYSYAINEIERGRLFSLIHKEELNEDDKIDLLIRTESYDFLHKLSLEVLDPIKFSPYWYFGYKFGDFRLTDPIDESSYIQKQKRPGKYKIKLRFSTRNHQTEITNKYRGRVIIDRNIGSLNYSRQVIEVEADNLEKEIEIEI